MKSVITIILSGLLLLTSGCSTEDFAPTLGTITGIVKNGNTQEVIEGCEVKNPTLGTERTDGNGHFQYKDVQAGTYTLTFRKDGFEPMSEDVNVSAGNTTPANVNLKPIVDTNIFSVTPQLLDFGHRESVLKLFLKNPTNTSISYTIKSEADWIMADPKDGVVLKDQEKIVNITVNRDEISDGHYEKMIYVETMNSRDEIVVMVDKGAENLPTVNTISVEQNGTGTSFIVKGSIVSVGSSAVSQHGIVYSTSEMPTLEENIGLTKLGNTNSPLDFESTVSGLEYEVEYKVRAYATNSVGTNYGSVKTITLQKPQGSLVLSTDPATNVTENGATLNGRLIVEDNVKLKEYGFYYGTTQNPSVKKTVKAFTSATDVTSCDVTYDLTELESQTTYYYQLYAIDERNGLVKGDIVSFTTKTGGTLTLQTEPATNIKETSASLNGKMEVEGNVKLKEYGFYYGTNSTPEVKKSVKTFTSATAVTSSEVSCDLSNLSETTTYYYQLYAIDEKNNMVKGSVVSFSTGTGGSFALVTETASEITETSAKFNGKITVEGQVKLKEYGFYYGTSQNPTSRKSVRTFTSPTTVASTPVNWNCTGLSNGTTYYYQVYAIDEDGNEVKGNIISFDTLEEAGSFSLDTEGASDIAETSATLNGKITVDGNVKLKEYGFYYGPSQNPTNRKSVKTFTTATTVSTTPVNWNCTGLSSGTTYYYQVYAIDESGNEVKGNVISFQTKTSGTFTLITEDAIDVTGESAVLNGKITVQGEVKLKEYGFYYGTSQNPTSRKSVRTFTSPTTVASTPVNWNCTGLSNGTTYYYQVYAIDENGNEVRGNIISFDTLEEVGSFSLDTEGASDIAETSATLNGKITVDGNVKLKEYGFYYGTSQNPTTRKSVKTFTTATTVSTTPVNWNCTGLSSGTTYYYQVYAIDESGNEVKGNVISFQTKTSGTFTLTTEAATDVTCDSAVLNGKITVQGEVKLKEYGFYYGRSQTPTIRKSVKTYTTPTTVSTTQVTWTYPALSNSTTYYYQLYAIDESGNEIKGNLVSFTTPDEVGTFTVSTEAATNITETSATLNGKIVINGKVKVKEYGFFYGSSQNPNEKKAVRTFTSPTQIPTTTVTWNWTGLNAGSTYYYQLYIIDENNNVVRGNLVTFNTKLSITVDWLKVTEIKGRTYNDYYLSGQATIMGNMDNVQEAGFIYRSYKYSTSEDFNINSSHVSKISCEIQSNEISVSDLFMESTYTYTGTHVRAYAILFSGEVIYSESTIYVTPNMSYPR